MRSVIVVAKGPSADGFAEHVDATEDVATINNSHTLVPAAVEKIKWCFFSHTLFLNGPENEHEKRIETWVSPTSALTDKKRPPLPQWFLDVKKHEPLRHIQYGNNKCGGSLADFTECIANGMICHHNTTNGAIHYLAKHGRYDRIRVIGVDGGRQYASGAVMGSANGIQAIIDIEGPDFLDIWKKASHTLGQLVHRIYGTRVEFIS